MQLTDLGCDFDSSYTFVDGDLKLTSDEDNLIQSITNRLNTKLESMNSYYDTYGTVLREYLGERKTDRTLDFLEMEVERTLKQDPRLQDIEVSAEYSSKGVNISVYVVYDDYTDLELNLVLTEDKGVNIIGS